MEMPNESICPIKKPNPKSLFFDIVAAAASPLAMDVKLKIFEKVNFFLRFCIDLNQYPRERILCPSPES
jgi:hypothetical protein